MLKETSLTLLYIPFFFGFGGYVVERVLSCVPVLGTFSSVIAQLVGSKPPKLTLIVHLSHKHRMRRVWARMVYWSAVPMIIFFVYLFFQTDDLIARIILSVLGVAALLATRVADEMFIFPLRIRWYRGSFAAINGAHHEFIAALPIWPLRWEKGAWHEDGAK